MALKLDHWSRLLASVVTVVMLSACGPGTSPPPQVGQGLNFEGSTGTTIVLSWGAGSDAYTAAADLEYLVVYSNSNNIQTVSDALQSGTAIGSWTRNLTTLTVDHLVDATRYHFAVLVRNASGQAAIYPTSSQQTELDMLPHTNLMCDQGQVLVGLSGRSGEILDRISLRCAPVLEGVVRTQDAVDGPSIGGQGGGAFGPLTCPTGTWVTGLSGNNGYHYYNSPLAAIKFSCSDGSQSEAVGSADINYPEFDEPFDFTCSSGRKARGLVMDDNRDPGFTGFVRRLICF